jgi:ABC-type multidrug transport system, ATPase component
VNKHEASLRTKKILQDFELYDVRSKLAMYLSGGMKQKILVAMAMAVDSKLLFLDEPTIGLDPVSRRQIWKAIKEKRKMEQQSFLQPIIWTKQKFCQMIWSL